MKSALLERPFAPSEALGQHGRARDAMTVRLASPRLAPLQLATWGHPLTTGLPTIDANADKAWQAASMARSVG